MGAYTAQRSVMEHLHANSLHMLEVRKVLRGVAQEKKDRRRTEKQRPPTLTSSIAKVAWEESTVRSRLRSTDSRLAGLIEQATLGSATFRHLSATVEESNGIVYVEPGSCGHGVRACLKIWMQVSGDTRFLRIVIDTANRANDLEIMRSLGHELQHVVELLGDPTIKDGPTMFNYMKRMAPTDSNRFETTAAVNAGNAVYDELREAARRNRR